MRGRARTRSIRNEQQVISALKPFGFEAVAMDGRSAGEQASLFWNAEAIVGMHGAALTNLIFARPGTKVVELFPSDFHEPGMFAAATYSELDYYYLRGEDLGPGHSSMRGRGDAFIDTGKLRRLLRVALHTPEVATADVSGGSHIRSEAS